MSLQRLGALSLLAATLAFGCASSTAPVVRGNATVRFATLEGGCWSIVTTANKVYEPVDLPSAFRIDGLAVDVVLSDAPGWASICMIGPLVHVDQIQAR